MIIEGEKKECEDVIYQLYDAEAVSKEKVI